MGSRRPTLFEMLGHMARLRIGLRGTCPGCGKVEMLDVGELARRFGHETPYARVTMRLRCRCGYRGMVEVVKVFPKPGSAERPSSGQWTDPT